MTPGLSIRHRLVLTHIGLTVLLLTALGVGSFVWYEGRQRQLLDHFLLTEAQLALDSCSSYWQNQTEVHLQSSNFQAYLNAYWQRRLNRPLLFKTTIYLLDLQNQVISASNHALSLEKAIRQLETSATFVTIRNAPEPFRVLNEPWYENHKLVGEIRVACLLADKGTSTWSFLGVLAILLTGSIIFSSALGTLLISRALRPVAKMSATAAHLSETHLEDRLPQPPGNDEIGLLASTLNQLLDRLALDRSFQERLVEDLSHQLRTPLTILRGRNENLLNKSDLPPRWREVFEDNLMDVDQIVSFLNTMLKLAQLEKGLEQVNWEKQSLSLLTHEIVEEMSPLWEDKELRLVPQWEGSPTEWENLPPLKTALDPVTAKQALMNVLDNTYRHAPPGSKVRIDFHQGVSPQKVREITLTITNQGPPIPTESLEKIFQRFYRLPEDRESEGYGLGLAIARSMMEQQKGRLRALNPLEGGAAFEFVWPAV